MRIPENVELAINEFVDACKGKFKENLVSIVLFGSYARGIFKETSDIDLLVIVKELPESVWERDKLIKEITWKIFLKYNEDLQPIFSTPEEIRMAMKNNNPIFFGILLGYKVLVDQDNFFEKSLKEIVAPRIVKNPPLFVYGGKRWRLKKIAENLLKLG
jgi:predicted nucleotidyltransferase